MREEHSIDTMSAFAAPAARGIELCRVRVMIRMQLWTQQERRVLDWIHVFLGTLWCHVSSDDQSDETVTQMLARARRSHSDTRMQTA